jgi:hypothetical protein
MMGFLVSVSGIERRCRSGASLRTRARCKIRDRVARTDDVELDSNSCVWGVREEAKAGVCWAFTGRA